MGMRGVLVACEDKRGQVAHLRHLNQLPAFSRFIGDDIVHIGVIILFHFVTNNRPAVV